MGAVGYLMGLLAKNGLPVMMYLVAFILPHGVLEIPAAILATPTPGKTVGEVYLATLGQWAQIMLGAVAPMLLGAALIEAWVTPRLALMLFT
jgi:uncharacterized membrane protein SpoIIM required for sporulation